MQMLIGSCNGTNYVARFLRSSEVIHWTVTLFRDSSDAGAEISGEIISSPDGEDDKAVRTEVEGLIPYCA
jgi:hypothetical protein